MTKSIEHDLGGETIIVQISTHDNFVQCIVDEPSPIKHGQTLFNPPIDIKNQRNVVIKCLIEENQRRKLIGREISAQMIFHEVISELRKEIWPDDELAKVETYTCNPFEEQYKYMFLKPEKEEAKEQA